MDRLTGKETEALHPIIEYIAELENAQSQQATQETEPEHQGDIIKNLLETRRIASQTLKNKQITLSTL